jgi:hypothetical protein
VRSRGYLLEAAEPLPERAAGLAGGRVVVLNGS